ncbi:MAG: hypothetical protein ACR2HX_10005 [Pyrinomonadaceae bacterium]
MKKLNLLVYGIYGIVALLVGVTALLFPARLEPDAPSRLIHILREGGAASVFVGLMSFWLLFHYDQRRTVHLLLTVFAFLIAGIHWFDYFGGRKPLASSLLNSVGFAALSALAIVSPRPKKVNRGVSC